MRIGASRWSLGLASLALALSSTSATSAAPTDDACFKQVFQQRMGDDTWSVRECEDGAVLRYRITYRSARAKAAANIGLQEIEGIVGVEYRLVGPATLLLDAPGERGGRAYLLHPVDGSPALSVAAFRYMGGDEESLVVRREGRRIRASTGHGAHVFEIGPDGTLSRAVTTGKPQRPRI